MSVSVPFSRVLPGSHRVRRVLANGDVCAFWYAWRGGPQILRVRARSDALLAIEVARALPEALQAFNAQRCPVEDHKFLFGLITRYLSSTEFLHSLAPRTRKDRRKYLDMARTELGQMELKALEAKGARLALINWRDRYKATPKTADERLGAVAIVLQWAVNRGEITSNPVKDFPRLYHSNRADVIWAPRDFAMLLPHCATELNHAVRLAALSGLRLGDLLKLPWTAVGESAILWQTGKSRGRRTVVIPIYDELRALLDEIPRVNSVTVLNSGRGRPWKEAGLGTAFQRAKRDAGIDGLRFHDLRGTAATNFIRAGLKLDSVATILGWQQGKVQEIAARYVTAEEIGLAMVETLNQNRAKTKAVNGAVNGRPNGDLT